MNKLEIIKSKEYIEFKQLYFDDIIGLDEIIFEVFKIYVMLKLNNYKKKCNIDIKRHSLNMIFYGNPGTGKTTIARLVAKMLNDLKYLSKGHLVEIDRSDLVGEYIGQTTVKTKKVLEKAKGGILFIDEAYSLYNEEFTDFGNEAVDIILKYVEDNHEDIVVILAGYSDKIDKMLNNNKGLNSRFPIKLQFEDYKISDLVDLFHVTVHKNGYVVDASLKKKMIKFLENEAKKNSPLLKHNGRFIRNIVEDIIRNQNIRMYFEKKYDDQLFILNEEDFLLNDIPK
jgi:stage V sporulation protein K